MPHGVESATILMMGADMIATGMCTALKDIVARLMWRDGIVDINNLLIAHVRNGS